MSRRGTGPLVACACAVAIIATACSSNKSSDTSSGTKTSATAAAAVLPKGEPVVIGQIIPIGGGALSLDQQALAMKASIDAYNRRGGVLGRPLTLVQCDSKGDPNTEADCAREMVQQKAVATIGDTTTANPDAVNKILQDAGISRIGELQASLSDYQNPRSYALNAGGIGIVIGALKILTDDGKKNISMLLPDVPTAAALPGLLGPGVQAAGGKIANFVPIGTGATDYSQFVLAAAQKGATGATNTLGQAEGNQVFQAAQQLGSNLEWTASPGTFSVSDMKKLGDFAKKVKFTDGVPPPSADPDFPALKQFQADMKASGNKRLDLDTMNDQTVLPWLGLHGFVEILKNANPPVVTAETVNTAFKSAVNVDMLGLIPPWTPGKRSTTLFQNVSNPTYYAFTFNGQRFVKTNEFDVLKYAFPNG
jgi:ABC-type branched-subunit amino acid transport system substrate-binding protein